MSTAVSAASPSRPLHIALWVAQLLLAAMFLMAGFTKLTSAAQFPYPAALTYFIGIAELAGAVGVVVPALTRIKPALTPLAASGLATIMVLAIGVHIVRSENFVMNVVLAAIAIFVAWGRSRKAPIAPR